MSPNESSSDLDARISTIVENTLGKVREELLLRMQETESRLRDITERFGLEDRAETALEAAVQPPAPAAPGDALGDLFEAIVAVDRSASQQEVMAALLEGAGRFAGRSALFLTRSDGAQGWGSYGFEETAGDIRETVLSYGEGPLKILAEGRGCVSLTADECAELCGRMGVSPAAEGLLVPFVLRDRLAAALYVDRAAEGAPLSQQPVQLLAYVGAQAVEGLALRQRGETPTLQMATEQAAAPGVTLWEGAAAAPQPAEPSAPEPPAAEPVPSEPPPTEPPLTAAEAPTEEAPVELPLEEVAEEEVPTEPAKEAAVVESVPETLADRDWELPAAPIEEAAEEPATPLPAEPAEELATPLPAEPTEEPAAPLPVEPTEEPAAPLPMPPSEELVTPTPPEPAEEPTRPLDALAGPAPAAPEEEARPWEESAGAGFSTVEIEPAPEVTEVPPPIEDRHGGPASGATEVRPPTDVTGPGWAFTASRAAAESGDEAQHEEARRLARLLVTEIKLYNEEQVEEGRRAKDIYPRLREDIDRSRQIFNERVDEAVRQETDYFHEEMVRILAGGNAEALGI